jgi:hypothetical protein
MGDTTVQQQFLAALTDGDVEKTREGILAGADVNLPIGRSGDETPLIRAVNSGNVEVVRVLLESGADPNLRSAGTRGWTPLMHAHDRPGIIPLLVRAGAKVDAVAPAYSIRSPLGGFKQSPGGETALHLAAAALSADGVRALLEAGATVEARDANGQAPLDYAIRGGVLNEAANLLMEAGAELTPQRLATMHSGVHSPNSDIAIFPFAEQTEASEPSKPPGDSPVAGERNVRRCKAEFCLACGLPTPFQRCDPCGLDTSWKGRWNFGLALRKWRLIKYCPGCGVELDTPLSRW